MPPARPPATSVPLYPGAVGKRRQPAVEGRPPGKVAKASRTKAPRRAEWQKPTKAWRAPRVLSPAPPMVTNPYGPLEDLPLDPPDFSGGEEPERRMPRHRRRRHSSKTETGQTDPSGTGPTDAPISPSRSGPSATSRHSVNEAPAIHQLARPHQPSFFLPGRVGGLSIQVLVDTGCTTNLLSKRIFDQLPRSIQAGREEYVAHGIMANGARLAFSGLLRTELRVRQYHGEETFVVGEIDEDAILGMPFLAIMSASLISSGIHSPYKDRN